MMEDMKGLGQSYLLLYRKGSKLLVILCDIEIKCRESIGPKREGCQ